MRKALITGASRGIGRAIRRLLEERGVTVAAPTRREMDLLSNASIFAYVDAAGDFDILINCAGINELATIDQLTDALVEKTIQSNLVAQMTLIRAVSPGMKRRGYGRIVNFASIWCDFSKVGRIAYSVSKAGVKGLTTAAAVELAPHNVLVNAVAPGFVNTEMTAQNNSPEQLRAIAESLPIRRLAEPEEIAECAYFLASEKNTFITGQTLFIDGGFSCI